VKVSELSLEDLHDKLKHGGLYLQVSPFRIHLTSRAREVAQNIARLYSEYSTCSSDFADFHIEINPPSLFREYYRPQINFSFDGHVPFKPLPYSQSFALFEWGLNWCIATNAHQYVIIHSAVVEKNGKVLIMPGFPGAGKSTLCSILVRNGWRLFSDEMALIRSDTLEVVPVPRPVSLKNESIDLIRNRYPDVEFGLIAEDTHKGRITHYKPPTSSILNAHIPASPHWLVFPKFIANAKTKVENSSKSKAMIAMSEQAFNSNTLGREGFETIAAILDQVEVYNFQYSNIDEAIKFFSQLSEEAR